MVEVFTIAMDICCICSVVVLAGISSIIFGCISAHRIGGLIGRLGQTCHGKDKLN